MITPSSNNNDDKHETEQVTQIAACLAKNFLVQLYRFCNGRNYFFYVGCLSEILGWSYEFYNQYRDNEIYYEYSKKFTTGDDCFHANDIIIAWGNKRLKKYLAQHNIQISATEENTSVS
jgi:hypothetical protein